MRLCDGHLARINGTARDDAAELNVAVQDFNEAQSLLPKSPDPELGLARVYVYGLKDIDKANDALNQAGSAVTQAGQPRLSAARRRLPRARRPHVVGVAQRARPAAGEGPDSARAEQDYQTALNLYQQVAP